MSEFDKSDKNEPIDAAAEIKRSEQERISKDHASDSTDASIKDTRGAPNLDSGHRLLPAGSKTFLKLIFICSLAIFGVLIWKAWEVKQASQNGSSSASRPVSNNLPRLVLPALTTGELPRGSEEEMQTSEAPGEEEDQPLSAQVTSRERRLSSHLIGKDKGGSVDASSRSQQTPGDNLVQESFKGAEGELQSKLKPLRLNPSSAGFLGDRDYLLTQGAMIDCQLETRLVTTQPGMTSCYTTRNVYSANGRVVLIDRGSKVVGHYQGGIVQGQASIFVLWTRLETPKGVIINLDSPGTDSLGESGMRGIIDTHFWQRFGGAIMMSFIGDFGDYVARQGRQNKGNTIQFNNTTQGMQEAAVEALKNSINIPPTLYKNQGERISIFVARDLDFGGVYGLKTK